MSLRLATLLALTLCAGVGHTQNRPELKDELLQPVANQLAAYLEARSGASGVSSARLALEDELAKLVAPLSGMHPLRRPADLGRVFWLAHSYSGKKLRKGKVTVEDFTGGAFADSGMQYAFRLPKNYDPTKAYALILAIPDEGQKPATHLRTDWTLKALAENAIVVCPEMPETLAEWDRVVVAGRPGGLSHVLTALRIATDRFSIDFDRIYVAGRGKGVPAAVAAGNYSPQRFAGIIGRAGDAGELGPENFSNLATLFTGGGARATAFQTASRAAGADNCELNAAGLEKDVWAWIQTHPRHAYPDRVTLVAGNPFPTRAYWLRIAPMASDATASARLERSTNTIHIDSEGVAAVTLYLNDELIDLGRPVHVLLNGVAREVRIMAQLGVTLDLLFDGTSDPDAVYVAEIAIDLAGTESLAAETHAAKPSAAFTKRLEAAGAHAAELWDVYLWCQATDDAAFAERVLRRIVRWHPNNAPARRALGYVAHKGLWFPSKAALERYLAGQDEAVAKSRGLVKSKDLWLHPDERALAQKGRVKDIETGEWLTRAESKRLASGWARQDLTWVAPDEAARIEQGLWKVDGAWLPLEQANLRHSRIDSMWCIPGPNARLYTTVDRATAQSARIEMRHALDDLRKVFGAQPALPIDVVLLRDEEQYDRFAFGDPDGRRAPTDASRRHVIHSAYFAESWFPRVDGKRVYRGAGVGFWDKLVPYGDLYGKHSARLAFGLAYVGALDPSPKATKAALAKGPGPDYPTAFRAEKRLPLWLSYGGAVYAERYFFDPTTPASGDAWWARNWSKDNLTKHGGLRPLADVLAMQLDPSNREDSQRRLLEAGVVVAFIVDGGSPSVTAAHAELKAALAARRSLTKPLASLVQALRASESELQAFASK